MSHFYRFFDANTHSEHKKGKTIQFRSELWFLWRGENPNKQSFIHIVNQHTKFPVETKNESKYNGCNCAKPTAKATLMSRNRSFSLHCALQSFKDRTFMRYFE